MSDSGVRISDLNHCQKLAYVEHQVYEAQRGNVDVIQCPYCGNTIPVGAESLGCSTMGGAVAAILGKMEVQSQLDEVARIYDNAQNMVQLAVN